MRLVTIRLVSVVLLLAVVAVVVAYSLMLLRFVYIHVDTHMFVATERLATLG